MISHSIAEQYGSRLEISNLGWCPAEDLVGVGASELVVGLLMVP